nr:maltase-glucoamylase, intestinal-like [Procambarus clarkii]
MAWTEPTCMDIALFDFKVRLVYIMLLCILLGLVVPFILASYAFHQPVNNMRGTCALNVSYRFPCVPGEVLREDTCHALGCCYDLQFESDTYAPKCFHSVPSEYDYIVVSEQNATLEPSYPITRRMGDDVELIIELSSLRSKTNIGTPAWPLQVKLQRQGNDVVRILLWSPENDTFSKDDFVPEAGSDHQLEVVVEEHEGGDFNITIIRVSTNETVMETVFGPLIYGEKYMEISSKIPTYHLYGLRKRNTYSLSPDFVKRERLSFYNREGEVGNGSTYGSHPFFMNFEKTGKMFGVYLKNSGPVEIDFVPIPAVVFRAVTGTLDLRVMAGPAPRDISRQYTNMVGRPAFPPYWALGYHLCRTTSNDTEYDAVVDMMETLQIPYESDCIDTRLNYPDSYGPLADTTLKRIREVKKAGRRFLLVQYPFVPVGSAAFNASRDFLLKLNSTTPYFGSVDGQPVGYPDYFDESTFSHWLGQEAGDGGLYDLADGVLLLRNTPLNEAQLNYTVWNEEAGPLCTSATPENCCPDAGLPFLPYSVTDPNNRTLCSSTLHPTLDNIPHLNVHNAYGSFHHKRVFQAMQHAKPTHRPFVTSQSTHPGSGSYGGHFGGLYRPNFVSQMKDLLQMLEMGLYGVPMVGMPLCGSVNDTTEKLRTEWCLRAHQTGAFSPFMISYNEFGHAPRNPPNFGAGFINQIKYYIRERYLVLPYIYTLFYEAYTQGVPVARPLFYEFPDDMGSRAVSTQYLLGQGLLVTPVFASMGNGTSVTLTAHFPPGCWYNFFTGTKISDSNNGTDQHLPTLFTEANVHVKGGVVLPLQGHLEDAVTTTIKSRSSSYLLLVALSCPSSTGVGADHAHRFVASASGWMYVDDGITPMDQSPPADQLQMVVTENVLTVTRIPPASGREGVCRIRKISTDIDSVAIFGAPVITKVTVNGAPGYFVQDPDTGKITVNMISFDWCYDHSLVIVWT